MTSPFKHLSRFLFFTFSILLYRGSLTAQTVAYQQLYTNANFTKVIDPSKKVGATEAAKNVTLSGSSSYSLPIATPVGTNGIVPSVAIEYGSHRGNGLVGRGWSIVGLSAISRTNKTIFLDNKVAPVECNNADVFSLDGVRLYANGGVYGANGSTYVKEEMDFANITSYGVQGSGPIYFILKDRMGTSYEYGSGVDSRVLTDDGNHILTWRLSKVQDVHGNYMNFVYETINRESLLKEINFTGNSILGFAPYNSMKFEYLDNRIDQNTEYEAGASISTKKILGSISIFGEGGITFKKYTFEYAKDDLYSYLQEVKEFGSDNFASQLNSTIFLYGPQGNEFVKSDQGLGTLTSINASDFLQSLDLDADGVPELLLNTTAAPGNYVANIEIYKKQTNGTFAYKGFYTPPSNQLAYKTNAKGKIKYAYVTGSNLSSQSNADFNGDGRDDILSVLATGNGAIQTLSSLSIVSFNVDNNPPHYFLPITYNLALPPNGFVDLNTARTYQSMGDFDGDGRSDVIVYVRQLVNEPSPTGLIHRIQAVLYSASENYSPKLIQNLLLPGTSLPSATYTNIVDPSIVDLDASVEVVNFDGDDRADLMVKQGNNTHIYSMSKDAGGNYIAEVRTVNTKLQDHKIYLGDFNGDTKTDVLAFDPGIAIYQAWRLHLSTGKGFESSAFAFQMPDVEFSNWLDAQNATIHPKDNLLIADLNGDGLSDILHGKSGLGSNSCYSSTYYLNAYYGAGNGHFLIKDFTFSNNVAQCPNGNGIFPDNSFLASDPNGDGRQELFYKCTTSGNVLSKLSFKENGQENLLHKVTDGRNKTIAFRYDLLSKGSPLHTKGNISNVTSANLDVNYPMSSIQPPLYVVSSMTYPDGIGGNVEIQYTYQDALRHHKGSGFLGFKSTKTIHTVQDLRSESYFIPNVNYSRLMPQYEKYYQQSTNTLLLEKTFSFSFQSFGAKLFQIRGIEELNHNALRGYYTKSSVLGFDYWGNATQTKSEVYKVANANIEETNTWIQYTMPGNASTIPSVVSQIDKSQSRTGASLINSQQKFTYFSSGRLKSIEDFSNLAEPITTHLTYTIPGTLSSKTVTASVGNPRKQLMYWDARYRYPVSQTETSVPSTPETTFDTEFEYSALWGKVVSTTGSNCITSTQAYDAFGALNSTQHKVGTPEAFTIGYTTSHWVNGLYHSFTEVNHPGKPDQFVFYDKLGRELFKSSQGFNNQDVYQSTTYNAKGLLSTKTNSYLPNETPIITSYQYDNLGRLIAASNTNTSYTKSYMPTNGDMLVTTQNTITGQQSSVTYDPTRKIIQSTDHGGTLHFEYDSWGNIVKTTQGVQLLTEKLYNDYNRLVSTTDINAGGKSYLYNALGQLIQETDALNNTFAYLYDDAGRLIERSGAEGLQSFTYGSGGDACQRMNLTHTSNYNNVGEDYIYDAYGRITQKETSIDGVTHLYRYSYNQYDQLLTTEFPSGFKTYNEYTTDGYLNRIGYATAFNGQGQPLAYNYIYTSQEFNGMGQPTKYLLGNGYTTTKTYQDGFLTDHVANLGNNTIYQTHYEHNQANGNILSRRQANSTPVLTEDFAYDNLDRLVSSQNSTPATTFPPVDYNYEGSMTSSKGNQNHNSIIGSFGHGAPRIHAPGSATGIVIPVPNMVPPLDVPDTDIISDLDQDISYTSFNKVASILEDNKELLYTYDIRQDRIKSVLTDNNTSEVTTKYYFNNYEIKITPSNQNYKIHYIHGTDGLCAIVTMDDINGTHVYYTYNDHLGSIQTVTDDGGNIEFKQSFDAWGRRRDPDDWNQIYPTLGAIMGQPEWLYRGFTGHEHVPELGLINMNGRMYDPALGRMCSPDKYVQAPLNTQSYNRYAYCLNNPLKYTDPSGDIFVGTVHTFFRDIVDKAFFEGGLDFTSRTARQNAWRDFDPSASWSKTNKASRIDLGVFHTDNNKSTGGRILQLASRLTLENGQTFLGKMYSHARNITGYVDNVEYHRGATVVNRNGSIGGWGLTLGNYINSQNMSASDEDDLFRHEYGHTLQSRLTGPLYLPMVGMPSLLGSGLLALGLHEHEDEWNEIQANRMSFKYYEKKSPEVLLSFPWDDAGNPREYVYDWYFVLTSPHAFMWWLNF